LKTQLLCSFTTEESFEETLKNIFNLYDLFSRKIFILKLEPSKELVVSYNIIPSPNTKFISNTIMAHRKKETNTMYTINALNRLIIGLNSGILDKSYQIEWTDYKNSIILTDGDGYKVMKTKLFRIIDVN
jgi:hypothetical protein